jgi:hypothetical protein
LLAVCSVVESDKFVYEQVIDEPIMMIAVNGGESRYYSNYDMSESKITKNSNDVSTVNCDRKTSRLAVASFILSLFGPMALFALPLAAISLLLILINRNRLKGVIYAILSFFVCGFWLILALFVINPEVKLWAELEKRNTCRYNMRILGEVIHRYVEANGNRLPDAEMWCDQLLKFDNRLSANSFKRPKFKNGECNFAFNKNISGQDLSMISGDTVMLIESEGNWNLNGNKDLLNTPVDPNKTDIRNDYRALYRHILLVNGSIEEYWISGEGVKTGWRGDRYRSVRWSP